ncbi:MAG: phosphatidylserine decarboxylase [Deltaproteobacteria bacterium]|nr:MAG: phosphatidylserine decarboxylase [Deltaproteobacteria bacterium]
MNKVMLVLLNTILPERLISRVVGHITRMRLPKWILRPFLRWYIKHFNVNLSEAARPLEEYDTIVDFFTRHLKKDARSIDSDPEAVVSPVDGAVYACGRIDNDTFIHAKGHPYTLPELLGDKESVAPFLNGSFFTIYLSPRDYHRIHTPFDGTVRSFCYVPGKLLPVNPPSVEMFPKLFAINERLTSFMEHESGAAFAVVKVGATNVGRIRLSYDDYVTNRWGGAHLTVREYTDGVPVNKADELGMFEMGSTVILLFSPEFEMDSFDPDTPMRLGQRIGTLAHPSQTRE